jgi:hypothetical protein
LKNYDLANFIDAADQLGNKKPTPTYLRELVVNSEDANLTEMFIEQFGEPDKKKIINIIKAEPALISGQLISTSDKCKNPRHCVVGALFYHAGLSNKRLKELQARYGAGTEKLPVWAHQMLWKQYGLSPMHTASLMEGNDGTSGINYAVMDDDDSDACEIVNKKELIDAVKDFKPVNSSDLEDLLAFANNKGGREFFAPFFSKAYKGWVKLGIKLMEEQTKKYRKQLAFKAAKK